MFSAPFLVTLLDRVKAVVRRVARPMAERPRFVPGIEAAVAPMPPMLRGLARDWMSVKVRALSALVRRVRAGEKLERPVIVPRKTPPGRDRTAMVRAGFGAQERLPRGFGWMCASGPKVREHGRMFAEWLNQPATRAMVLAAPERMAQVIGPILNATGEGRPEWFPVAARRAKRSFGLYGRGPGCGVDAAGSCDLAVSGFGACKVIPSNQGSRGCTPPLAIPTSGGGCAGSQHRELGATRWDGLRPLPRETLENRSQTGSTPTPTAKRRFFQNATNSLPLSHDLFVSISKHKSAVGQEIPRTTGISRSRIFLRSVLRFRPSIAAALI
jgi:hypothetical protein